MSHSEDNDHVQDVMETEWWAAYDNATSVGYGRSTAVYFADNHAATWHIGRTLSRTFFLGRASDINYAELFHEKNLQDEWWRRVGLVCEFVERMNDDD